MRVRNLFSILTPLFVAAALCVGASDPARAQAAAAEEGPARAPSRAEKYDEYGRVGHCDMTARLDNFAIGLQNNAKAKGFIVGYDPQKKRGYAERNLKISRHYLVHVRGISPERVSAVDGGSKEIAEGRTELWVVPEGAEPPVEPPAVDKYAAKDFSGKFDSHVTDGQTYKVLVEMGYSASEIAYAEFAEKLKGQPESVGYLLVRTPQGGLPGDWRRVGRRDEQILGRDYGVEAGRLTTLNGGRSAGDYSEVEFWILPKTAPPPPSHAEEPTTPKAAVRLNRFDSYGSVDKNAERWMLENLAELLRDNPRASACLVARQEMSIEMEEGPGEEAQVVEEEVEEVADASTVEGEEAVGVAEEEEAVGSAAELAERWKDILVNKYGIEARRVVVLEGKRMPWSVNRLTTWLVPENAPRPDPFARDEDEPEEDEPEESETQESAAGADVKDEKAAATPPPL